MNRRKIFAVVFAVILVLSLALPVFAEEIIGPELPEEPVSPSADWVNTVQQTVENYKNGDVNIIYTEDSVSWYGIDWESSIDVLTKNVYLEIIDDLPAGYVIYDSPDTPYIDGIRVNGNTVDSTKFAIDWTQDINYEVIVKVDYAEGILGDLARMSDGTYDWTKLLENPVGLLMALYYVLATLSVIIGIFAMWRGKNKKVKTADEISKSVEEKAHESAMNIINNQVLPIVTSFQNTSQALVKAFALTTSKSKEAPTALLDVLQTVSSTDAASAIEQAKATIANDRAAADAARQETLEKLQSIAQTIQEVESNGTEQKEKEEDVAIF